VTGRLSAWPALAFPAAVVAAAFIWSTSYTATKAALADVPPLTLGAARFLLAAGVLWLAIRAQGIAVTPSRRDRVRLGVGGLLGITLYFAVENLGVDLATAADAALLVAAYPAITMLLESTLFGVPGSRTRMAGVAVAIAGVYLIVSGNFGAAGSERVIGDVLLIVSGVVWAFYNFSTRAMGREYSMLVVVYWQTLVGAVAFVPLALSEHGRWEVPGAGSVALVVYLAVLCSVAAFLLYGYGLRGMKSSSAVNLLNLVPVFGLAVSVAVLSESVRPVQLLGGAVVMVGVVLGLRGETYDVDGSATETNEVRSRWRTQQSSA
jgi:drug/metabolite transporter (DMT)-like permease